LWNELFGFDRFLAVALLFIVGLLKSHRFMWCRELVNCLFGFGGEFLEQKKNVPTPEMTTHGKYRCRADNQEYDTREDYETHCMEEHTEEM
jgi:hypothetical protein